MGILFGKSTHQKIQTTPGDYVNGDWVPGTPTISSLTADIQPMSGEEVQALSIGDRNLGMIKIYTDEVLKIADEGNKQKGDKVIWDGDGQTYECTAKGKRDNNLINHNKYFGELRKNDDR